MPKDKKSKIDDIKKLRQILDAPYDFKASSSEDNENLKSIRQRLSGESLKKDSKDTKITDLPKKYDNLEPRVTIHPKKEEITFIEPRKSESIEKTGDVKDEVTKEDLFRDEDLYEIEKLDISEPEFLEVKSEEIIQKEAPKEVKPFLASPEEPEGEKVRDTEDTDQKPSEWKSEEEMKREVTLEKTKDKSMDELPEFEKIEEFTESQSSNIELDEDIPTWEPISEENIEEGKTKEPEKLKEVKPLVEDQEQKVKEKSELTKKTTEGKDVIKARILSSLKERKPKKKIKEEKLKVGEDRKTLKKSKENILKRIISKKPKIETEEAPEVKDRKEAAEGQPIPQESFDKVDEETESQSLNDKIDEEIPLWEPVSEDTIEEEILEPEKIKEEKPVIDAKEKISKETEKETKIAVKEKDREIRRKKKEEQRLKKIEKKEAIKARKEKKWEAKIAEKEKLIETKRRAKEQKAKKKEEKRLKKVKEKNKLIKAREIDQAARLAEKEKIAELKKQKKEQKLKEKKAIKKKPAVSLESTSETEELSEWESYDVDDEIPNIEKNNDKPYKYGEFTLYKKEIKTSNGKIRTIHFFSKKKPELGQAIQFPDGYEVKINKITKLPYLRKKK